MSSAACRATHQRISGFRADSKEKVFVCCCVLTMMNLMFIMTLALQRRFVCYGGEECACQKKVDALSHWFMVAIVGTSGQIIRLLICLGLCSKSSNAQTYAYQNVAPVEFFSCNADENDLLAYCRRCCLWYVSTSPFAWRPCTILDSRGVNPA